MGRGTVRRRGDEQRDEVQATTTKAVVPAGPWFVTIRTRMWNTVLLLAPWWAYIAGTFLALTQLSMLKPSRATTHTASTDRFHSHHPSPLF